MKPVYVLIVAIAGAAVAGAVTRDREQPAQATNTDERSPPERSVGCPAQLQDDLDPASDDEETGDDMPDDDVHAGLVAGSEDETNSAMPHDDVHRGLF